MGCAGYSPIRGGVSSAGDDTTESMTGLACAGEDEERWYP
jgi:hypothetical protein